MSQPFVVKQSTLSAGLPEHKPFRGDLLEKRGEVRSAKTVILESLKLRRPAHRTVKGAVRASYTVTKSRG